MQNTTHVEKMNTSCYITVCLKFKEQNGKITVVEHNASATHTPSLD